MSDLRSWYLDTFADGQHLEGKELREHLRMTLRKLEALNPMEADS